MRINNDCWLLNKPIAHRGLWGNGIIENSLPAYENAIKHGYPIEIDVYQSKDGVLLSFHDQTLKRMTGADGYIFENTYEEIKKLNLNGSEHKIPTLKQVLDLVDGKVPLLIEFKDMPDKSYVNSAVKMLKEYKGEFAVQSFNPLILKKIKKLAPEFLRGILATASHGKNLPFLKRQIIKNMSLNFLINPDFISYSFQDLPLKKSKTKNLPVITWTVTDQQTADKIKPFAKNIIFEKFIPNP
ncbi:MAG: glycerophosphodiester phosphodiesterase [Clostridia bacterium]|nr:glycerophosphodiester phosphodiesterase [Clostridia bacterium]